MPIKGNFQSAGSSVPERGMTASCACFTKAWGVTGSTFPAVFPSGWSSGSQGLPAAPAAIATTTHYISHGLFCVLCPIYYILCSASYVLCLCSIYSMFHVLCLIFCSLCSVFCSLCSIFYVLYFVFSATLYCTSSNVPSSPLTCAVCMICYKQGGTLGIV